MSSRKLSGFHADFSHEREGDSMSPDMKRAYIFCFLLNAGFTLLQTIEEEAPPPHRREQIEAQIARIREQLAKRVGRIMRNQRKLHELLSAPPIVACMRKVAYSVAEKVVWGDDGSTDWNQKARDYLERLLPPTVAQAAHEELVSFVGTDIPIHDQLERLTLLPEERAKLEEVIGKVGAIARAANAKKHGR